MRAGVPQDSILGPTLFILYTNDAEDNLPPGMDLAAYADSTTLFIFITSRVSIPGSSAIMQQGVDALSRWGVEWKIKFEPSKTQAMTTARTSSPDLAAPGNHFRRYTSQRGRPPEAPGRQLCLPADICAAHSHDPLQSTATPRLPAEGLCYPRAPWPTPSLQWVCPTCAGVLSPGLAWCATLALGQAGPDPATSHPHHRIGLLAP